METYTLNRFYHEAKALLEKYNVRKEDYSLDVDFSIVDNDRYSTNAAPHLKCSISYGPREYSSHLPSYYGRSITPAGALNEFETKLMEATGKLLRESVGVELPEDAE